MLSGPKKRAKTTHSTDSLTVPGFLNAKKAIKKPSEVRDRGHLVLTPLILAQPEEVVPTAAVSEK
eukprot:COSAG01_NODE_59419_length_300_cov_0.950249_1_plen_64_part_01